MKHLGKTAALFGLLGAGLLASGGCEEVQKAQDAVCCTEFQVGGTITADIEGSAQGQVAAQAVADFAGIASAAVDDITTACRAIAQDLDADKAQGESAEKVVDKRGKMDAWCKLAVTAVGSFK